MSDMAEFQYEGAELHAIRRELASLETATVYEASGRQGLIDIPLIQIRSGTSACGMVRIAACAQDDNLAVHAVMEDLQEGEILLITMPTPTPIALCGDLLATQAQVRGAAGILVNGAVRDVDSLRRLTMPIWARFIRASGATRTDLGARSSFADVGGVRVLQGDFMLLDSDGVVVVPQARVSEIVKEARAREHRESEMLRRLWRGELSYDIHGLRGKFGE